MPSIFSRSRTQSKPTSPSLIAVAHDEFGRITSRGTNRSGLTATPPTKKDKKKDLKDKARSRTISTTSPEPEVPEFSIPDGSFLPLNLELPKYEPGEEPQQPQHDYGYLSHERHVVLGLEQVALLVDVVGEELGTRGLTTPFIFSTLALDISSPAVKRLIQAFLRTCRKPSAEADRQWREEAKFAGPHELGMCLRWGLARVVRIMRGQEMRGLLSYTHYEQWRNAEIESSYSEAHFAEFLIPLEPLLQSLLVGLLTLLTRFTAHSSTTGHTPPTLSPLFGPLLFGLGPSTLAFHHAYVRYLHATTATEHLMLSFIRWQDVTSTLGVPTRLKAWIQGYPAMLPPINKQERPQPRRGARTIRVLSVRRNVRMYSPDLVKTCASWMQRPRGATSSSSDRSFAGSKEWERIAPPTLRLTPQYSDNYRKRMDLASNFQPDTGTGSSSLSSPSLSSSTSTASTTSTLFDEKEHGGLGTRAGEDRFRSLTDLKWGEFESMGFGDLGANEKKLQFDLTEGARAARAAKRATLTWQDFSSTGFTRTDAPLSATLQFSPPVSNTISSWPAHSAEIHRKLKKTQKALPPFGWDTEPILGSEEVVEEAFLDVFCDLVYGGGWMDGERGEDIDRECNWALVEFKSLPVTRSNTVSGTADPRTSASLILFEEFVPLEYRQQLAASGTNRRRLPSLFSNSSKPKQWKPAPTLNGRPYVVGYVPRSPSYREVEFEGLLRSNGSVTKIITLNKPERQASIHTSVAGSPITSPQSQMPNIAALSPQFLSPNPRMDSLPNRSSSRQEGNSDSPTPSPSKKASRFRLPISPSSGRKGGLVPSEYDTVDFDTRLASFDEDELDDGSRTKQSRRQSRDDAWVDILVANSSMRNTLDVDGRAALKGGRSDPELASQEVSEVLAAVRGQMQIDNEDDDDIASVQVIRQEDSGRDDSTMEGSLDRESALEQDSGLYPGDAEEDEEEPLPQVLTTQKRPSYFDLYPERRLARAEEDDPRARFERRSIDSDRDSQEDTHSGVYPNSMSPPIPSKDGDSNKQSSATTSLAWEEDDIEPVLKQTVPAPVPALRSLPVTPLKENGARSPAAGSKLAQSKTASLIEMYRERERGADAAGPASVVPPSRLPIRTGASLAAAEPARSRSTSPALVTPPKASTVLPATAAVPAVMDDFVATPKRLGHEDIGLITPGRYVHGAPLHNVLEEEEEEA